MKKIYLHSISGKLDIEFDRDKLEEILSSGYLLSRRLSNYEAFVGFNGLDYISLCDYEKRNLPSLDGRYNYNSYHIYIEKGLSMVLDNDIKVIRPTLIFPIDRFLDSVVSVSSMGLSSMRASDLPDEVQVKDRISLNHLIALTFSKKEFLKYHTEKEYLAYLKMLKESLNKYHYDIDVLELELIKTI